MDPVTTLNAGISLYQAGGLVLLLLAMFTAVCYFIGRWMMGMIRDMGTELKELRNEMHRTLIGCVTENTATNRECIAVGLQVRDEVAKQTIVIAQQNSSMRERPCLIQSGAHPVQHATPLPRVGGA